MPSVMEYVESLPNDEQTELQRQYELYVKDAIHCTRGEILNPEAWLKNAGYGPQPIDESRIRGEFKRLMIGAGHGGVYERALYFVKAI